MTSQEMEQVIEIYRERLKAGFSETNEFNLDSMRAATRESQFPPPPNTRFVPTVANGVPCEWVLAPGSDPARRLLYLHGGGYVLGTVESYRDLAGRIAAATGCSVLNADYRLAPEHPFPAAVDDGLAALRWMRTNGPSGAGAAATTWVAGDSAGGGLTLAVLMAARNHGDPAPTGGITLSAWTDLAITGASVTELAEIDPVMGGKVAPEAAQAYLGTADPKDPLASPLYGDYRGLPPLLMQVGGIEVLLDDTRRVAARAEEAGVDVTVEVWPGMVHVWHLYAEILPEARQAIDHIGDYVKGRVPAQQASR